MAVIKNKPVAALRAAQAIFAVIILGLTIYVTHWWRTHWHASSPSQINFLLFSAVWTFLVLITNILLSFMGLWTARTRDWIMFGMELMSSTFWFAGFVATAVFLHDRVCYGHVCSTAKAATVFGAFEWVLFTLTLGMGVGQRFRRQKPAEPSKV